MPSQNKESNGFVLIEAIGGLSCLLLVACLLWEVYRREVFQVVAAHITCFEVRERGLGEQPEMTAKRVKFFLESSLGKIWAEDWEKHARPRFDFLEEWDQLQDLRLGLHPGLAVERWFRYPQFLSFLSGRGKKHHQEILKRCLFPLS